MAVGGVQGTLALLALALLLGAVTPVAALEVLPLAAGWALDNSQGLRNASAAGFALPADAHSVLHDAGVIGDPLYR